MSTCVHPLGFLGSVLLIFLLFFVELCFLFVLFVSVLCFVWPVLPVSLDCSFLITPLVFSNVYYGKGSVQPCHRYDERFYGSFLFAYTYAIMAYYHHCCVVYWIQFYMIKFISDLQQVCVFLQVLRVSSAKKLHLTYIFLT